jgi:hypothetical protein
MLIAISTIPCLSAILLPAQALSIDFDLSKMLSKPIHAVEIHGRDVQRLNRTHLQ